MIAPAALADLVAATRIDATRNAVVTTLAGLLGGVTVKGHPGKLDINDVVGKAIVAAPGVAIGYSRVRDLADPAGTVSLAVDYIAYIVVEDWVDKSQAPPRAIPREVVGHAIGQQLLLILRDFETASWGLPAIEPPMMDPAPELRPVFTVKTAEQATALYAVTWTQSLVQEGEPFFGFGPPIPGATDESFPDSAGLIFDVGDTAYDELPPEIQAHISRDDP